MFSSATTLVGAPGQSAYVAANMAAEAAGPAAPGRGLTCLAVAWGPIEDAGYLAERPGYPRFARASARGKTDPGSASSRGASCDNRQRTPDGRIRRDELGRSTAISPDPRRAAVLRKPCQGLTHRQSTKSLPDRLASLEPEEALALLKTIVAEEAATILRLPAGSVDPLRPLSEVGMDLLMAVELRLALESRLRVDLPLVSLAEGTSVSSIAARLAGALATGRRDGRGRCASACITS